MKNEDLVIFDPHSHPEDNFDRFRWIGNLIMERRPRSVIVGGDLARMDSMSRHGDKPTTTFKEDLEAMHEAIRLMFGPILEWNTRQRSHRHRPHPMRTVWLEGNHEERARRVAKEDPHGFASLVDWDDPLGLARWYDERYEYGQVANIHGIDYTHIPRTIMGRPMAHNSICKQTQRHMIYGHGHSLNTSSTPIIGTDNGVRMTLSAPAFMPDQNKEPYSRNLTTGWVYGILIVRPSGSPSVPFSFDYLSMKDLEELHG